MMNAVEELRFLIFAAQREGSRALAGALRPLGLTTSQAEVLSVLRDHGSLSLITLGDLLICETGSPSRLVQGLVDDGLVEKTSSPDDKRMVTLSLTENGREKAERINALENRFYELNAGLLNGAPIQEILAFLWRYVDGKPAGMALARRKKHKNDKTAVNEE